MATYRIMLHYDAYAEADIEAENKDEAADLAYDNIELFNFEGGYDIVEIEEIKK